MLMLATSKDQSTAIVHPFSASRLHLAGAYGLPCEREWGKGRAKEDAR